MFLKLPSVSSPSTAGKRNQISLEMALVRVFSLTEDTRDENHGLEADLRSHCTWGIRTTKRLDRSRQPGSSNGKKIQTENALLHPAAVATYVGWLTQDRERRSRPSPLVVEFETKQQANRAIQVGLVLEAYQHDCVVYDRACKLKQCFRCPRHRFLTRNVHT